MRGCILWVKADHAKPLRIVDAFPSRYAALRWVRQSIRDEPCLAGCQWFALVDDPTTRPKMTEAALHARALACRVRPRLWIWYALCDAAAKLWEPWS